MYGAAKDSSRENLRFAAGPAQPVLKAMAWMLEGPIPAGSAVG
jgi:hypothetical protein